jgi:hypothetical protein
MTKRKLRKNADISPPQSPHDGIHTCSRGCSKPGCTRTLRDTIEEQDQQIEALKRDVLEQATAVRQLRFERIHDISHMGGQDEEISRLRAEVERLEHLVNYWRIESECDNARWLRCLEDLDKLRGKPSA